jgi:hypothetical protein
VEDTVVHTPHQVAPAALVVAPDVMVALEVPVLLARVMQVVAVEEAVEAQVKQVTLMALVLVVTVVNLVFQV